MATSEAGEALKELTVAVFSSDRVEVIRIRAPYIDDAIVARTPVRIEGLDMGLRTGDRGAWISWTADRITPAQTARPGRAGEPA